MGFDALNSTRALQFGGDIDSKILKSINSKIIWLILILNLFLNFKFKKKIYIYISASNKLLENGLQVDGLGALRLAPYGENRGPVVEVVLAEGELLRWFLRVDEAHDEEAPDGVHQLLQPVAELRLAQLRHRRQVLKNLVKTLAFSWRNKHKNNRKIIYFLFVNFLFFFINFSIFLNLFFREFS